METYKRVMRWVDLLMALLCSVMALAVALGWFPSPMAVMRFLLIGMCILLGDLFARRHGIT